MVEAAAADAVVVVAHSAHRGGHSRRGKRRTRTAAATTRRIFVGGAEAGVPAAGRHRLQAGQGGLGLMKGGKGAQDLVAVGAVDELGPGGRGAVVSRPAQYKALHAGHDAGVGVN